MIPPELLPWWRKHIALGVAIIAVLALLADVGYQIYAARLQHRNATTATKVARLSKAQCGSDAFIFAFFNALALDTSPGFGSPQGGPITPGARARLINELYAAERAAAGPLRSQGCRIIVPKDP